MMQTKLDPRYALYLRWLKKINHFKRKRVESGSLPKSRLHTFPSPSDLSTSPQANAVIIFQ